MIEAGMSYRQMAQRLHCNVGTISRMAQRVERYQHHLEWARKASPDDPEGVASSPVHRRRRFNLNHHDGRRGVRER
ncbi:hypothetical protein RRG08_023930 [Elysia crispata]|uniref:Uncharacterized protein n=1 Tax=Elysia crispata TaxID=231223 RepID=A0AAE1D156_9GAST|nr:hypothetical protein RRG08_023930 [Elysia crispata]